MSSIAALAARRAFTRQAFARPVVPRRFYSASKIEEAGLDKGSKRDPELYVCVPTSRKDENGSVLTYSQRFCSVSCRARSCSLDGKYSLAFSFDVDVI